MRRSPIALAVATVSLFALAPSPSGAADTPGPNPGPRSPDDVHCLAEIDLTFSPGISMTPSSGTFTTGGETGTNRCDGPINGYMPTGPATRGEDGRYGVEGPSSCTNPSGVGEWTIVFTMPTTGGRQHVEFPVRGPYGPLKGGGVFGGTFTGEGMYGHYAVSVLEGDCVTTPITKVHLDCDEWIIAKR
jgi:hypothetical protein